MAEKAERRRVETPDGPGFLYQWQNATRWQPAWVTVDLDNGNRKVFQGKDVVVERKEEG